MNEALITFIYVDDAEASDAFYRGVLGLPLVTVQPTCRIYQVSAAGFLGVCSSNDRPTTPAGVVITLVRPDVDVFCDRITTAGLELEKAPAHNERFSIYNAFVRDPDGYLVEIQRFDDPDWANPI